MNNNNRVWLIGSILLSAVVLVAGWFVGVSPLLAQAASADATRAEVEAQNRVQQGILAALKGEYAQLADFQSELDGMRVMLPSNADLPNFLDKTDAVQVASGVRLTNVAVSEAVPYLSIPEEPVLEEAPSEEVTDEDVPATDEEATAAAAEAAAQTDVEPVAVSAPSIIGAELVTGENFILIPISLAAEGSLEQVMAFIGGMQGNERLLTINDVVVEYDESKKLFTTSIEASIYVMTDSAPSAVAEEADAATAGTVN